MLETALAKAMTMLRPTGAVVDDRDGALRAELARLDAEAQRLAAAIAAGGEVDGLLAALKDRERRRADVRGKLAAVDRAGRRDDANASRVPAQLRHHLTDWQGMLHRETRPARQAPQSLLAGRLVSTPRERDGERFYEFEGPGTARKVIAGLALPTGLVTR